MPILNDDGTPFHLSPLRQFNPNRPDYDLFDSWDAEAIRLGGSPLAYYEVFISAADIDTTYNESRRKVWSMHPIEIWGTYDPPPSEQALGPFGLDSMTEVVFDCNYKDVLRRVGHLPLPGSRIRTPHLREDWEVVQCQLGEFRGWRAIRLQIICKRFQPSSTDNSEFVPDDVPSFKIDDHAFTPGNFPGDDGCVQ